MTFKKQGAFLCAMILVATIAGCGTAPDLSSASANDHSSSTNDTIAWLSDPQYYSEDYPEIFESMTRWIQDNAEAQKIRYTLITGDLVNHVDKPKEWKHANQAIDHLDDSMPWMTLAGNHDRNDEEPYFSTYLEHFGSFRYKDMPTLGGDYQDGVGRYDILEIGGKSLLLVSIGYGVDGDGVAWLNEVLESHQDMTAVLAVHSYLHPDGNLTTDGKVLREKVVTRNPNVKLVLCGHKHGVGRTVSTYDDDDDDFADRVVNELVVDYQSVEQGGNGYFCLLSFDTQKDTLTLRTYSPHLDDYNCFPDELGVEEFTIPFSIA